MELNDNYALLYHCTELWLSKTVILNDIKIDVLLITIEHWNLALWCNAANKKRWAKGSGASGPGLRQFKIPGKFYSFFQATKKEDEITILWCGLLSKSKFHRDPGNKYQLSVPQTIPAEKSHITHPLSSACVIQMTKEFTWEKLKVWRK